MAKSYWGAQYAKPQLMLFNINGPCANRDPGHLDSPSFRGVRHENAPTWLCSVMGKSGLFSDYLIKMAQVITWFSLDEGSGFTYWPDGPLNAPQAGAAADQQPRRGGAERDDGAPRRGQRPTGSTDSGRSGVRHGVHRRPRRPRPLAAQERRRRDRPAPHRRTALPGALVGRGVLRLRRTEEEHGRHRRPDHRHRPSTCMVKDVNSKGIKLDDARASRCTIRSSSAPSTPPTTSAARRPIRRRLR